MDNPFILPNEAYERELNPVEGYFNDGARYLQLHTGQPFEVCREAVKRYTNPKSGSLPLKDPDALVLTKDRHGDRHPESISFMRFIGRVEKNNLRLSPSMAAYVGEEVCQSRHALFMEEGVRERNKIKAGMKAAEQAEDWETAAVKDGEQKYKKTNNNSHSGASASKATMLFYKSTHSTLTSTCRTATSYGNSANEKFLAGNRHYYNSEITKANLVSLLNTVDVARVEATCEAYGLTYPSVEETMAMVLYSTRNYWESPNHEARIERMIANMTPAQRATVVYTADLYHLHAYNNDVIQTFLTSLTKVGDPAQAPDDETFAAYDGDVTILAYFLCYEKVQGRSEGALKEEDPETWAQVKATGRCILETLHAYRELIQTFFLANTMPPSIHAFPSAYRRAAIVSDTDSTMFTMLYWVEKVYGYVSYEPQARRLVFAIIFLVSELMIHILAKQSRQMGVADNKLRLLQMKNEFYFATLAMTTRSKHYFASQDAKEGVMYAKAKMEIKGVGLRDSKVPPEVNQRAKTLMTHIVDTVKQGETLEMATILTDIANMERDIIRSIKEGEPYYMTVGQIKAKNSYKNAEEAPAYQQYLLWRDVFAPTFGESGKPPYSVVKVSLLANNRTRLREWMENMSDAAMANRLNHWLTERKRQNLTTLMIPSTVVETMGIPDDIIQGVDTRKIIFNTMSVFYLILESLGIFLQDKNITRLVSDFY